MSSEDKWRTELLKRAAKNRPQHHHDVENLNIQCSLLLYKRLDQRSRHCKGSTLPCGSVPTVLHISWECPIYEKYREPLKGRGYRNLPTCTRYSALILNQVTLRMSKFSDSCRALSKDGRAIDGIKNRVSNQKNNKNREMSRA